MVSGLQCETRGCGHADDVVGMLRVFLFLAAGKVIWVFVLFLGVFSQVDSLLWYGVFEICLVLV